jgi:hypothetical protein
MQLLENVELGSGCLPSSSPSGRLIAQCTSLESVSEEQEAIFAACAKLRTAEGNTRRSLEALRGSPRVLDTVNAALESPR